MAHTGNLINDKISISKYAIARWCLKRANYLHNRDLERLASPNDLETWKDIFLD